MIIYACEDVLTKKITLKECSTMAADVSEEAKRAKDHASQMANLAIL